MNDRHEEMAQATTKGRQLAIQWWQERLLMTHDFESFVKSIDSALSRIEAETEARVLGEVANKIRSPMFQQFLRQGFWHAHHVDMTWRYNGQNVGEEADWLKDVWYAIRSLSANELPITQELADVSTPVKLIDRDQAIIATSVEADFERGTWTFEPKGQWSVSAGDYYLIPIQAAEKGE